MSYRKLKVDFAVTHNEPLFPWVRKGLKAETNRRRC